MCDGEQRPTLHDAAGEQPPATLRLEDVLRLVGRRLHREIVAALDDGTATARELATRLSWPPSDIDDQVATLLAFGLLERAGEDSAGADLYRATIAVSVQPKPGRVDIVIDASNVTRWI